MSTEKRPVRNTSSGTQRSRSLAYVQTARRYTKPRRTTRLGVRKKLSGEEKLMRFIGNLEMEAAW